MNMGRNIEKSLTVKDSLVSKESPVSDEFEMHMDTVESRVGKMSLKIVREFIR